MSEATDLATVKQFIRRNWSLEKKKEEAKKVFELATEEVTITSQGFEGGSASGQMNFRKMTLLTALEDLILEEDADAKRPPSSTIYPNFGGRTIQT